MRLFLGGRCYTAEKLEKDYLAEVANYSNDRWEAPQRAARLAARYRHAAELHWSATLAEIERVKRLYQTKINKSKKEAG